MKLYSTLVLFALAPLALPAQDQTPSDAARAWITVARQAQQQVRDNQFAEAADSGKKALQLAKRFGSSDPKLGSTYHLLGLIYRDWGHCAESRSNYSHAIAIWLRQPVANPRYIFNSITSLISVMCECDEYESGEKVYRTYRVDLQKYTSDSLDEAKLIALRGILARGRKDYAGSEVLLRQSIALMEKSPLATQLDIAIQRSSLAVLLDKQGHHVESLAESMRAIDFLEHNSPKHPSLLASINNAACSLADLGRREEAARMFKRALEMGRELYGEDNRVTAKVMLSYSRVLRENNETPAAADYLKKGTEAFRRSLTRDSATVDVEELRKK
jgi:tetratricopeptide (TPR) repeat protein